MKKCLWGSAVILLVQACAARQIPGTTIEDTRETRSILAVMETFRTAVEGRDTDRLLSLVSPSFRDNSGTATPDDDLDYAQLKDALPKNFEKLSDVRLEMTVRKIEFLPAEKAARAVYTYNSSFRMPGLTARPHRDSEIKEMYFVKESGTWKIVSGI